MAGLLSRCRCDGWGKGLVLVFFKARRGQGRGFNQCASSHAPNPSTNHKPILNRIQYKNNAPPPPKKTSPDIPVYALTDRESVRRRLALRWGVSPFLAPLGAGDLGEGSVQRTLLQLKERGFLKGGDLVVVVSDIRERDVNEGGGGGVTSDGGGGGGAGDGGGSGVQQSGGRTLNIRSVQVRQVP
jgi:hypothetical protein